MSNLEIPRDSDLRCIKIHNLEFFQFPKPYSDRHGVEFDGVRTLSRSSLFASWRLAQRIP